MRIAVLVLATLGAVASGLTGLFQVGGAYAEYEGVSRMRDSHSRWAHQADTLEVSSSTRRYAAMALGVSALFGGLGAVAAKRRRGRWAAVLCGVAGIAPLPFWLGALCATAPLLAAAPLALAIKAEPTLPPEEIP